MLWILDGYNVIHTYAPLEKDLEVSLEKSRKSLIAMCEWLAGVRGDFRRVIIVFDGKSEFAHLPVYRSENLEVVYSETGETADRRIVKLLESQDLKEPCTVVSNDNYVRNHAKVSASKALDVKGFIDFYLSIKARAQRKSNTSTKSLPQNVADDITSTYKKHLGLD